MSDPLFEHKILIIDNDDEARFELKSADNNELRAAICLPDGAYR